MSIVSSHEGRMLRSKGSELGQAITLTDKTGYTMMVTLPVSPMLVQALEVEADRHYWVTALQWLLGPSLKKGRPTR